MFVLYWFVTNKNIKLQNFLLLAASYVFYGWWDWRFLSLILFSTIVDYSVGLELEKREDGKTRKILLLTSILVNLGFLGFFKYYNFFLDNLVMGFSFFGKDINPRGLNIILPVGISFYTFQTLSYSIDVYKRKMEATRDFIAFAAFVSFFPQLVAGPIERAKNLLPQFFQKRTFEYDKAVDGSKQILWGFFKKVVIADNCAIYANMIFNNSADYSGSTLVLGVLFFTFQIYGDFSGYSDIAIGVSRLFGFSLMKNFAFPYFSRDIAEFWRRWHISLSTWFRDYLYIPLGGSRGSTLMKVRNTFIIFIVSGFWHGADWTFIIWGALNAAYFLPLLLSNKNRTHMDNPAQGKMLPSGKEFFSILTTFAMTVFAWIFFRAENMAHAVEYIRGMVSPSLFSMPQFSMGINEYRTIILVLLFVAVEWIGREHEYAIQNVRALKQPLRYAVYYAVTMGIIAFGSFQDNPFIYFQF